MQLDGYIRVSQVAGREGERFISPDLQREQIELWARLHGVELGEVFEELDQSGARADRPLLMRALARVEEGCSQGLIVAKLDRFGRSVIDGLAAIARIEDAGGTFVSVADGFDLATPTGKLVLRILLSMGEWELDRVRASWDAARARAVARGVHVSSRAPFGYLRADDGRLRPDPRHRPALVEIFDLRASGQTPRQIAEALADSGHRTQFGTAFSAQGVQSILRNRVYLGEAHSGPYFNRSAHPALIDTPLWRSAQFSDRPPERLSRAPLAGIALCASCGRPMTLRRSGGRHAPTSMSDAYRCVAMFRRGAKPCPAPAAVRAAEIEPLVEELAIRLAERPPSSSRAALRRAEDAVSRAEEELFPPHSSADRSVAERDFAADARRRRERLDDALLVLGGVLRAGQAAALSGADLRASWSSLSPERRREMVLDLLDCVIVRPGEAELQDRVRVCRRGDGPLRIARRHQLRPPRIAKSKTQSLPRLRRWPERRIEAELRALLAELPVSASWPQFRDFERAGRARLHAQLMAWGGPHYWAHRFGLTVAALHLSWDERRLRAALAPLMHARTSWPTQSEFKAAGLGAVYSALFAHGGLALWAQRFGIEYSPRHRRRWSQAAIETELRALTDASGVYPSAAEFSAAGQTTLAEAIRRHGGREHWAERLQLEMPPARPTHPEPPSI